MTNKELMRRAIELSKESVRNGGGPFGAVIAKDGEIIAEGSNCVTIDNDTMNDNTVTVRDRDTMEQTRVPIAELREMIDKKVNMKNLLRKL